MYIVIGILAGIIILQFIIMWKYQRQVKDICRQLAFMMKHDSNMLINHEFDVGGIGKLSDKLNELLELRRKEKQHYQEKEALIADTYTNLSHDIRTPLSMIMGYANRIAENKSANKTIREQAEIVQKQSVKIKELVQDLNLVSQLEYEMQPLHKEVVRLSKLLRSYMADLLNTGISDSYIIGIQIDPDAENAVLECDARLISRAVNNLVQNSVNYPRPKGHGLVTAQSY